LRLPPPETTSKPLPVTVPLKPMLLVMSKATVPLSAVLPISEPPSNTSTVPPLAIVTPLAVAPEETIRVPPLDTVTLLANPPSTSRMLPDEIVTVPLPDMLPTVSVEGSSTRAPLFTRLPASVKVVFDSVSVRNW